MEEEQKKLMNENNEEELRKKEERDRIKMKALEAERIRQQIELEQKIKPTQNGTQKAILQLPSTSVAPTTVSTTNDQTMESSQGLIGQIGGVMQTTTTGEYQETATIESTTSVRQRKPRTRIFTKESHDIYQKLMTRIKEMTLNSLISNQRYQEQSQQSHRQYNQMKKQIHSSTKHIEIQFHQYQRTS